MTAYENIIEMWNGYTIITAADLDLRLNHFRIQFAYNSAKIENPEVTYHTTREVFEDGLVKAFRGTPKTLTEINNQRICYDFLLPKIIEREPLTVALIKEAHEITTMGTYDDRRFFELGERPGVFKKHDFVVGRHEVGSLPDDVETDIAALLSEINQINNPPDPAKILKAAAYFHSRFEFIHAFADGNGRVGRTMMNYYLMINNHPPLIVYDEDRTEYYNALEAYDANEDIKPLFAFLVYQLEKTWQKALNKPHITPQGGAK
ncbi:MAG: Fic family protein [Defluviitaleaceae bacterium]|nr:Fic family protein [Defluviitaleaceae bacterium]